MTGSKLTEDDFSTVISDLGDYLELPVIELSEGDYMVAYGHLDKNEFIGYCNQWFDYTTDGDPSSHLADDDEVLWTWAKKKKTPGFYEDEWSITWKGVDPQDDDAFPITLVSTW